MTTTHVDTPPVSEEASFESHLHANLVEALAAVLASDGKPGKFVRHGRGTPKGRAGKVVSQVKDRAGLKGVREISGALVSPSQIRQAIRRAMAETSPSFDDPVVMRIAKVVDRTLPVARRHMSEVTIERMVDVLVETQDPLARVSAEIDASNASARVKFMSTFPTVTAEEVSAASGSRALNKHQTASRWKADGKIFSVPWRQMERYPAFQFDHGIPKTVVAKALSLLPAGMSQWEIAFWFVSTNGWLDGAAPLDRLDDADRIAEAARMEGEAVIG